MNVSLTPELEDFVATQLKTGHYRSASEIVREALRNQIRHSATEKINRRISLGREQLVNGQVYVADDNYFESKRQRIREKYLNKKEI